MSMPYDVPMPRRPTEDPKAHMSGLGSMTPPPPTLGASINNSRGYKEK